MDITLKNVEEPVQKKKRGRGRKAKNALPNREDNDPATHIVKTQHPDVSKQGIEKMMH